MPYRQDDRASQCLWRGLQLLCGASLLLREMIAIIVDGSDAGQHFGITPVHVGSAAVVDFAPHDKTLLKALP
jgi:hypothetical protein